MIEQVIYGYNSENRDKEGSNGLPKNWRQYKVVGETKLSWLVEHEWYSAKVNKKTFKSADGITYVVKFKERLNISCFN